MKKLIQNITHTFKEHFQANPLLVFSPGRVNLIGEHTDYNKGFVLPAAVDKGIVFGIRLNQDGQIRLISHDKKEHFETTLTDNLQRSELFWPNYLLGVVDELQKRGYSAQGFDCVFGGNIPIGAGMSSSAALASGTIFGLDHLLNLQLNRKEMALIAQAVENNFIGLQCGIMDQFACLHGKTDKAILLDCDDLKSEAIPFEQKDVYLLLCDTGVRRELASSEYNIRRGQCELGTAAVQKHKPEVQSLRQVSLEDLNRVKPDLDPIVYRRCRFVLKENQRVLDACQDLKNNDFINFGKRMNSSHMGLRDDYEVSCKELDVLAEIAQNTQGVLGARMMGGGFGGCTINLVQKEFVEDFKREIQTGYQNEFGYLPKIYTTNVSAGTHIIE